VYKSKDSERRIREMDQELREKKRPFCFFPGEPNRGEIDHVQLDR